jgi:hypothetical protein
VTVTAWVKSTNPGGEFKYLVAKGASGCNAASYAFYTGILCIAERGHVLRALARRRHRRVGRRLAPDRRHL